VGRRRRGAQGRAEGRVRGRMRDRGQGRPQGRRTGEGSSGSRRGTFDVGEIEGYANRLKSQLGNASRSGGGTELGGGTGLGAAASGLAGAASGLAGGSLASRLTGGGGGLSEAFENEVRERLDLLDERLRQLEDEVRQLGGGGAEEPAEPPESEDPEFAP
jgi:hypothetical protein